MTKDLLKQVQSLEVEAKEYGFYWQSYKQIMDQIRSECLEVEELLTSPKKNNQRLQEEIGDLLHAVISLCVYYNFDSHETLNQALNKFKDRYEKTKELAKSDGYNNFHGKTVTEMMQYWNKAKILSQLNK